MHLSKRRQKGMQRVMNKFPEVASDKKFINACRQVIETKTAHRFQGYFIDLYIASCIVAVYDKLQSDENRAKFDTFAPLKAVNVCLAVLSKHAKNTVK